MAMQSSRQGAAGNGAGHSHDALPRALEPLTSLMLLSVCIPSYNRGPLLAVLVRSVLDQLPASLRDVTEIVISENHSTDATPAILDAEFGTDPRVRICRPEAHLPTAEENLCFALSQCAGEFVWTLGDDDGVEPETLARLGDLLVANEHDFLLFNSRSMSYHGVLKTQVQVPCLAPRLDLPLLDFVRISGFWFTMAGFSMSVFRRSCADLDAFRQILSIGRIYSHVVWLIDCFHDRRFAFVNAPLVNYRENLYVTVSTDHWEKVSAREKTFLGGLWSTGFLRLIDRLAERGIVERSFIREVVDRSPSQRYYFANELLSHFLRGLRKDVDSKQNTIPIADLAYFRDWVRVIWPNNIVLISLFEEVLRCRREGHEMRATLAEEIAMIFRALSAMRWFDHFHVYDAFGYAVYHHGSRWFAIRRDNIDAVAAHLEFLDFRDASELLGVCASEAELIAWIADQPPAPIARHLTPPSVNVVAEFKAQALADTSSNASKALLEFNSRLVASMIRGRKQWRFHEWFRIVRALNSVFGRVLAGEFRRQKQRGRQQGNSGK